MKIEDILQRYWTCETSIEEEKLLKKFFSGDDVPEHLLMYKELFAWEKQQHEYKLNDDFNRKVLHMIEKQFSKSQPIVRYFYPFLKISAVAMLLITIGLGIYTSRSEKHLSRQVIYLETFTDPEDALEEVNIVFDKLSNTLMKGKDALDEINMEMADSIAVSNY